MQTRKRYIKSTDFIPLHRLWLLEYVHIFDHFASPFTPSLFFTQFHLFALSSSHALYCIQYALIDRNALFGMPNPFVTFVMPKTYKCVLNSLDNIYIYVYIVLQCLNHGITKCYNINLVGSSKGAYVCICFFFFLLFYIILNSNPVLYCFRYCYCIFLFT